MTDTATLNLPKTTKKTKSKSQSDEAVVAKAKQRLKRLQKKKPKGPVQKDKVKIQRKRGVVYLGHLPHGFYEEELRGFFTQFGHVKRVKVSRSPKTGKSKGYAFIEFAHDDVAKIVAETMNNYLMFERLLKAQYIPPEKVHDKMFPACWITTENYPSLNRRKAMFKKQEEAVPLEKKLKHYKNSRANLMKNLKKLKELGVADYMPQIYDPESLQTKYQESVKSKKAQE